MEEKPRKGKKKKSGGKRKKWSTVDFIIIGVLVVILAVCIGKLIQIGLTYKAGTDEYKSLQIYAEEIPESEEAAEEIGIPKLAIDYASLQEINSDFAVWLYIPLLDISYPVVQGVDNEIYLGQTFEKNNNIAGAIFLDFSNKKDFSDRHSIIYGHNMKNGSMFGKLKNFVRDEELCDTNPYFYLYTPEKAMKYRIVSYYITNETSPAYTFINSDEEYDDYYRMMISNSAYKCEEEIPEGANIVTLSTCYGKPNGPQRFVVHGMLVETESAEDVTVETQSETVVVETETAGEDASEEETGDVQETESSSEAA